jgi:hypothetical protein
MCVTVLLCKETVKHTGGVGPSAGGGGAMCWLADNPQLRRLTMFVASSVVLLVAGKLEVSAMCITFVLST